MVKLTCAIITHNEQQNIVPLLKNVYPIFDEIVVVDGISTDKTIKHLEDFRKSQEEDKIKLFLFTQSGPRYSIGWKQPAQRNLALEKSSGDWILTLDADERLDGDARLRLEDLVANGGKRAYALPTYHYWEDETHIRADSWWYPNYHYRFWKNREGVRYSRHQRHCFPVIKGYPEVRKLKKDKQDLPCVDQVPIHHYHHAPIKKKPTGGYRANIKDVKTLDELVKNLEVREVRLRKRGPLENE